MDTTLGSRAVIRSVEPGQQFMCPGCDDRVKFTARIPSAQRKKVICNVYEDGRWVRTEHWHLVCYTEAGEPHGAPG